MNTPWCHLPIDVQCRVFDYLSLDEIAVVLPLFPHELDLVKNALHHRVGKRHMVVTNRQWLPMLLELYTPEFFSRADFEYVEPQCVVRLLNTVGTDKLVTVLFVIWHLFDVSDLLLLLEELPEGPRYNIELEFEPNVPHVYDLSMVVNELHKALGLGLRALAVKNFGGDLQLDMHKLEALEALLLINTNVTFTTLFDKSVNLRTFTLHPNCDGFARNHPAELGQLLPLNVEKLRLGQCVVVDSSLGYKLPKNVTDLSLFIVRDSTMKYLPTMIESSLCFRTSFVYQSGLAECSIHANYTHILWLLEKEKHLKTVALTSIKNDSGVWDLLKYELLHSIKISKSNLQLIDLPPHVLHLDLSGNNMTDIVETVLMKVPPKLLSLDVSGNLPNWTPYQHVQFPEHLVELGLANCNIGNQIDIFQFPASLEKLDLESNSIEQLEYANFPNFTKPLELRLARNVIRDLQRMRFPKNTTKLMLCENSINGPVDFSLDMFGEPTQIEWLLLSNTKIESLADIRLPHTLRILEMDRCRVRNLENVLFPASLQEINLTGSKIQNINNVTFEEDSRLVHINLTHNRIDADNLRRLRLPSGTKLLYLGWNRIESIPKDYLLQFTDLRSFSVPSNRLRRVALQVPASTRMLDFSKNRIKDIKLQFPKGSFTRLGAINLLRNMLTHIDPGMLGHGNGSYHQNLIEIDVSENRFRDGFNLGLFPSLLSCVFLNGLGLMDGYGYDIGANILGHSYCMGKRIET